MRRHRRGAVGTAGQRPIPCLPPARRLASPGGPAAALPHPRRPVRRRRSQPITASAPPSRPSRRIWPGPAPGRGTQRPMGIHHPPPPGQGGLGSIRGHQDPPGNLITHLRKLEDARYVQTEKTLGRHVARELAFDLAETCAATGHRSAHDRTGGRFCLMSVRCTPDVSSCRNGQIRRDLPGGSPDCASWRGMMEAGTGAFRTLAVTPAPSVVPGTPGHALCPGMGWPRCSASRSSRSTSKASSSASAGRCPASASRD